MSSSHVSLPTRIFAVLGIEAISWLITQRILAQMPWTSVGAEALRTLVRLESLALIWYLAQPVLRWRTHSAVPRQSGPRTASVLLMCVPLLVANTQLPGPRAAFFAVTSIAVGMKEEVLFRGFVQGLLQRYLGGPTAIVTTSAAFTLWHYGSIELTPWTICQLFLASLVLGSMYWHTGSLAAVVTVHALYDALWFLAPTVINPVPVWWGLLPLAAAVAIVSSVALPTLRGRASTQISSNPPGHAVQGPAAGSHRRGCADELH